MYVYIYLYEIMKTMCRALPGITTVVLWQLVLGHMMSSSSHIDT